MNLNHLEEKRDKQIIHTKISWRAEIGLVVFECDIRRMVPNTIDPIRLKFDREIHYYTLNWLRKQ